MSACARRRAMLSSAQPSHRSEEHTSELQSQSNLVCRLLLEKKILTSRLSLSKHLAHNLGNLLLLGKIGVFHNRRNASSRLLMLISKHLMLCIYLVFRILARSRRLNASNLFLSLILHLGNFFLIVQLHFS